MKKVAGILMLLTGLCGAAAYWVDLTQFTDLNKGFSTWGSVWVRYLVVAVLLAAVALLASRIAVPYPPAMQRRNCLLAVMLSLCGVAGAEVGTVSVMLFLLDAHTVQNFIMGISGLLCAWWFFMMAGHWGSRRSHPPAGGMVFGVVGCMPFLALTLLRFAGNYSSIYRFAQTTQTFSALAAVLLASVLLRAGFHPEQPTGQRQFVAGMWAFYLCSCCEVPQAAARFLAGQIQVSDLFISLFLGCVGVLGACCALYALGDTDKA